MEYFYHRGLLLLSVVGTFEWALHHRLEVYMSWSWHKAGRITVVDRSDPGYISVSHQLEEVRISIEENPASENMENKALLRPKAVRPVGVQEQFSVVRPNPVESEGVRSYCFHCDMSKVSD
jgi:hypothetical protein